MQYLWLIIKGFFVGIANIIPGVSGGTMAVSFGIYDDVIHAFTHVRKEWKASLKVLGPLVLGALIGVAGFSMAIEWLLADYTLYTAFAFVGLILGGLPIILQSYKDSLVEKSRKSGVLHVILFIVFFLIVTWMGVADVSNGGVESISLGVGPMIALFFVGLVSAAAMVVPGISGSLLMLIMGYYYAVVYTINGFTESLASFDIEALIPFTLLLSTYALGMVVGIILISKVIDYFFTHFPSFTYASILGLVLASPIAVIFNTQALDDLSGEGGLTRLLIALFLAAACYALTYVLGKTEDTTEELSEESQSV